MYETNPRRTTAPKNAGKIRESRVSIKCIRKAMLRAALIAIQSGLCFIRAFGFGWSSRDTASTQRQVGQNPPFALGFTSFCPLWTSESC